MTIVTPGSYVGVRTKQCLASARLQGRYCLPSYATDRYHTDTLSIDSRMHLSMNPEKDNVM